MSKPKKGYIVVNIERCSVATNFHDKTKNIPVRARPTLIHGTKVHAEDEARRLAERNKGETFMVFATTSAYVIENPVKEFTY